MKRKLEETTPEDTEKKSKPIASDEKTTDPDANGSDSVITTGPVFEPPTGDKLMYSRRVWPCIYITGNVEGAGLTIDWLRQGLPQYDVVHMTDVARYLLMRICSSKDTLTLTDLPPFVRVGDQRCIKLDAPEMLDPIKRLSRIRFALYMDTKSPCARWAVDPRSSKPFDWERQLIQPIEQTLAFFLNRETRVLDFYGCALSLIPLLTRVVHPLFWIRWITPKASRPYIIVGWQVGAPELEQELLAWRKEKPTTLVLFQSHKVYATQPDPPKELKVFDDPLPTEVKNDPWFIVVYNSTLHHEYNRETQLKLYRHLKPHCAAMLTSLILAEWKPNASFEEAGVLLYGNGQIDERHPHPYGDNVDETMLSIQREMQIAINTKRKWNVREKGKIVIVPPIHPFLSLSLHPAHVRWALPTTTALRIRQCMVVQSGLDDLWQPYVELLDRPEGITTTQWKFWAMHLNESVFYTEWDHDIRQKKFQLFYGTDCNDTTVEDEEDECEGEEGEEDQGKESEVEGEVH